MEVSSFGAPIPGNSLFTTPNDVPWERPSELDTVDDALAYYFTNILNKPIEWIWYAMVISGLMATIISIVWLTVAFRKLLPAIPK